MTSYPRARALHVLQGEAGAMNVGHRGMRLTGVKQEKLEKIEPC